VHIMNDRAADPLAEFRRTNTAATLNLAEQAARAGVKRFVFVSTIKVNGEENNRPFRHDDAPMPIDPYGISKLESEIGLREIAARTGMEVVIIRPPLVYGPGARGNFALLVGLVRKRIPLPFASLKNRRTLVAVQNLVDLIITCAAHPAAGGEIFLAGDGEDLSTPELIRGIAAGLGVKPMLIPFPSALLHMAAKAVGKEAVYQRLCGSLQVDMSQARKVLGWTPVVTPRQGLKLAVK
ncbi:NAD-dependent epimerase/dehydratase family protein, partial [Rhizobium phaseoli]